MKTHLWLDRFSASRRRPRLQLERLEERETPTVGLGFAFKLGAGNDDAVLGVTNDRLGNTFVTGYFRNTVDFDPSALVVNRSSNGDNDIFLAKYNRVGQLQWVNAIGGLGSDAGNDIAVDASGNVLVTGYFSDVNVDFDPGAGATLLSAVEGRDIFVAKYAGTNGDFVWAKSAGSGDQFSSLDDDEGVDLAVDGAGNVVVTGYFQNTVDFDPGAGTFNLSSFGSADIFLWKFDSTGNFVAAARRGDFTDDRAESIVIDRSGNFYVTGTFSGFVTFDPDNDLFAFSSNGDRDVYLMQVDANLKTIWADAFGGTSADVGTDVAVDSQNRPIVVGSFQGVVDFDSGAGVNRRISAGSLDAFIVGYTAAGLQRFVTTFGGTNLDYINGVVASSPQTIAVAGAYAGTVDFDPSAGVSTQTSAGGLEAFAANYTSNGAFVWVKSAGGVAGENVYDIASFRPDSLSVAGSFNSAPADFDPNAGVLNLNSAGGSDGFVWRLADRPDLVSRTSAGRWGRAVNNGNAFGLITFAGAWNEKLVWKDTMTGDFNGDGRTDVLSRNSLGDWWLAAMNPQGRFVNRYWGRSDPKVPLKFVNTADFTGDGLPDVCGFDANGYWHILVNTGAGFRDELRGMWEDPTTWLYATAGDVDGDGFADLIGRNKFGEWWVTLNTGDGGFDHTQWGQWTESLGWLDVAVADFNADGRLDVVARNKTGAWFVGLGQSNLSFTFSNWGNWAAIQATIKNVFYGDFNGDGFLDVVGRNATHQLQLSAGNGAAFSAPSIWGTMALGTVTWIETLVGDYDGDGRDDLAGRTSTGAWFVARSPGAFTSSQWTIWLATAGWRDTRNGGFRS